MSGAFLVGGLTVGLVTGYADHAPWHKLPPSFVRAGWALGVLSIAALLRVVPGCTLAHRLGGLLHLLWPPLSYAERYEYAQLGLLAEAVGLGGSLLLLLRLGRLPESLLLLLLLVWVGVMISCTRI